MSGYVPPHLRGSAAVSPAPSAPPRTPGGGFGGGGYGEARTPGGGGRRDFDSSSYGGAFGGRRGPERQGGSGGTPAGTPARELAPDSASRGRGPPEAVFTEWLPPPHVACLTQEQVEDIRKRLDISVEVEAGQPLPAGPLESFDDMVRAQAALAHAARGCATRSPVPARWLRAAAAASG